MSGKILLACGMEIFLWIIYIHPIQRYRDVSNFLWLCTKLLANFFFIIVNAGTHPRFLVDGFEIGKKATLEFLEKFKTPVVMGDIPDKEILKMVARTTLRTKVCLCSCPYLYWL
jgi:hypothetical protein